MKKLNVVGRQGAYDDEGNLIIPFDYVEISTLNNVYYARENFNESTYHLYTEKGKVDFPLDIVDFQWDDDKTLVAVKTKGEVWKLVEMDYENNILNIIYENCIFYVSQKNKDLLILNCNNNEVKLFSRKAKKVIASFNEEKQLFRITEKGYIREDEGIRSLWDFYGNKILDNISDIQDYKDFFLVIRGDSANYKWGAYSYEGDEIFPCKYYGDGFNVGIKPYSVQFDEERIWLFIVREEPKDASDLCEEKLIASNGDVILTNGGRKATIAVFDDTADVIIEGEIPNSLYKLQRDHEGKVIAKKVLEADKIKYIHQSGGAYEVWKGRKRGACYGNGKWIIPLKWQLIKKSYDKVGDVEH